MMKKMIICVWILVLVIQPLTLSVELGRVHAAFGGGDGSPNHPYLILTAQDLSDIRMDLTASYRLGADIDLADYDHDNDGKGWMPIGTDSHRFTGTLDGNGYAIRGLTINRPTENAVGLFGYIDNAQLQDIRLLHIHVAGRNNVGGLVGQSYNGSTINNSSAAGHVSGTNAVGVLAGNIAGGTIHHSYATGNAISAGVHAGGLVGVNNGTINNSYATASVDGLNNVGGLVGINNRGTIDNTYATGRVSGARYVGGLAGWNYNGSTIRNSYATGSVIGTQYIAGLVGWNYYNGSIIENSYATGTVTGSNTGGLVALNNSGGAPSVNSYWNIETTGQSTSATGEGKDTADLKKQATYAGLDFDHVWGIRENETYPYLLAYKPELHVDPLAATRFNLTSGQDALSVTGVVYDSSIGEQVMIAYVIKNSANTVTSATYDSLYADGGPQSFARTISLAGWSDGTYTLHITAEDTYNDPVAAPLSPLVFMVDSTPPSLADLSLSTGTLSPPFTADRTMYTASVTDNVDSITVTPVSADASDAVTVSLNGGAPQPVASGAESGQLMLDTGANTIAITITALNGLQTTYSVTVTREAPVSDSTDGSGRSPIRDPTDEPCKAPKPEIVTDPGGGVKLIVDPCMIEEATRPDGTAAEVVNLDDKTLNQALEWLQDAANPVLTIAVNDTARAAQVPLPAFWIATVLQSVPNAVIEVRLNGSSFQLVIDVLDLEGLALRLGVELEDLKVHVIMETVDGQVRAELDKIAASQGVKVIGNAVDYKVTAVAENGQTAEIREFGGTYMIRSIVVDTGAAHKSLIAVLYDPVGGTLSFVPSVLNIRLNGQREVTMSVPHNSIYAIVETEDASFTDMIGHWAKADVELMAAKLIVKGVTENRFSPDADITRAEFTALLVRALGLSMSPNTANTGFGDVTEDAWYASAVESAVKAGLVKGMTPQRFVPDDRITREQMAVMIANALAVAGKTSDASDDESGQPVGFLDQAAISAWARDSVAQAVAAGIIAGKSDGTFAPAEYATRAQAAVMLKRFLQHVRFID